MQIQANGFSQQTRLSIKMDNISVKQLFAEIEKRTDLAFVYNTRDVDQLGTVDVDFTNEEIGNILDYCLKGKGINYSIVNNHVVIRKGEQSAPQQKSRVITGKVLDKETRKNRCLEQPSKSKERPLVRLPISRGFQVVGIGR